MVKSAPWQMRLTMSTPLATLPDAPTLMRSRRPLPTSALCTNIRASVSGIPTWSSNSCGAAPVPPSEPSTMTKSGAMAVARIALQIDEELGAGADAELEPDRLAAGEPAQRGDELHRTPSACRTRCGQAATPRCAPPGTPRVRGDLRAHLRARQHPAQAGFGALGQLDRDGLHLRQSRPSRRIPSRRTARRRRGSRSTPSRSPRSGRRRARR